MSGTVIVNNYTIFERDLNGKRFSVELIGGEPVYLADGQEAASLNAFLAIAVAELGGSLLRNGTVNENALEHFGGNANPSVSHNAETDVVSIGGAGVGGSFKADFSDGPSANTFEDFAQDLLGSDPALTKLYDISTSTNGGANRIQILRNDEIVDLNDDLGVNPLRVADSFIFKWSGADVSGTSSTDDFDTFVQEMGLLFAGTQIGDGTMTGFFNQTQTSLQGDGLDIVKISGLGVGGTERWQFESRQEAENFKEFFDTIIDTL